MVCGHIHHAELRLVDGVLYANDGDWVESCTALVEHMCGRLELVQWNGLEAIPISGVGDYAAVVDDAVGDADDLVPVGHSMGTATAGVGSVAPCGVCGSPRSSARRGASAPAPR